MYVLINVKYNTTLFEYYCMENGFVIFSCILIINSKTPEYQEC